ncbi:MAG: arginine decarboxylase, pyruvoyl-dependent [Armatimonadetes bacterium]|nr:arginine decarboxylase, pyruvoyl-dependent [Armatimonadota bacterium]
MWERPTAISVVAGRGEGRTELTAFDRALMDAGIANLNFIRVTSILPAGVKVVPVPEFVPGMLTPIVYASISSHTPGERVAAAVGLGFSKNSYGVIMEYEHPGAADNAEAIVRGMVEEAMAIRDLPIEKIVVAAKDHVVQRIGCAVAGVVFWRNT